MSENKKQNQTEKSELNGSVIVKELKERGFTIVPNNIIYDEKLSWKAKGLMCYFLSRPEGWTFIDEEIETHSSDGITKLKSGIAELKSAGYLKRVQKRREDGKIYYQTIVREIPVPPFEDEPLVENPPTVNLPTVSYPQNGDNQPLVGNPLTENDSTVLGENGNGYPQNGDNSPLVGNLPTVENGEKPLVENPPTVNPPTVNPLTENPQAENPLAENLKVVITDVSNTDSFITDESKTEKRNTEEVLGGDFKTPTTTPTDDPAAIIWGKVLLELQTKLSPASFQTWFGTGVRPIEYNKAEKVVYLGVDYQLTYEWITQRYSALLKETVRKLVQSNQLKYEIELEFLNHSSTEAEKKTGVGA